MRLNYFTLLLIFAFLCFSFSIATATDSSIGCSVFGGGGYITLPSLSQPQASESTVYYAYLNLNSPEIETQFHSQGIEYGVNNNLSIGINFLILDFYSTRNLGYSHSPLNLRGNSLSFNLKYLIPRAVKEQRDFYDARLAFGLIFPVDSFDEFKTPVKNVLNVIREGTAGKLMRPIGYIIYGNIDKKRYRTLTAYAKFGESVAMGLGISHLIFKRLELIFEVMSNLYTVAGVIIDKTQYGAGIRFRFKKSFTLSLNYLIMNATFSGESVDEHFQNRFDFISTSISYTF